MFVFKMGANAVGMRKPTPETTKNGFFMGGGFIAPKGLI